MPRRCRWELILSPNSWFRLLAVALGLAYDYLSDFHDLTGIIEANSAAHLKISQSQLGLIKKKILARLEFDVFVSEDQYNRKAKALVKFQKSLKPVEPLVDSLSSTPIVYEKMGSCCGKLAQRFLVLENECSSDVEGLVTASQSNEEETREILSARAETSFGSPLFWGKLCIDRVNSNVQE